MKDVGGRRIHVAVLPVQCTFANVITADRHLLTLVDFEGHANHLKEMFRLCLVSIPSTTILP